MSNRIQIFAPYLTRGIPTRSIIFWLLQHQNKFRNWRNPWHVTGKLQNIIWLSREINRKRMLIDALAFMKLLLWTMIQDQHAHFWAKKFTCNSKGCTTYTKTKMYLSPSRNFSTNRLKTITQKNIMQEIENFAARRTPLEYTQHFTVDIQNLYFYNDDCTSVRSGI